MSSQEDGPVHYNPKTKSIVINESYTADMSKSQKEEFEQEVLNWNHLNTAFANYKGTFPPQPNSVDQDINKQVDKIMMGVAKELKVPQMHANGIPFASSNKEILVKQMTQALDLIMSKPPWEPAANKLQQIVAILGYRCDVLITRGQWADAFVDAECLVTFSPQDWKSHFRKARCLKTVEKYAEANECFKSAKLMAKVDPGAIPLIENAMKEIEKYL